MLASDPMLFQRLPFPVRNVLRRWRSLAGVTLGVGIALGISMGLLGVSGSTVDMLTADFRRSNIDLYVTARGGKLIALLPGDGPGTIKNARNTLTRIRAQPGVSTAIGSLTGTLVRTPEGRRREDELRELLTAVGIAGDPTHVPGMLALSAGRWIRRSNEVVVGVRLSAEKRLGIGNTLRLGGRDFTVVGVGRVRGLGMTFVADSLVYLDYDVLRELSGTGDVMSLITVDTAAAQSTREAIATMRHVAAVTPADLMAEANHVGQTTIVTYWILISLTLAIAGLFVNTVLQRTVTERRLQFATLRAIGVPSRTILLMVAGEAVGIGLLGSLIGVAIAEALGAAMNAWLAPMYSMEYFYRSDLGLLLLILGLAVVLGVVSGVIPARTATHVDPVLVLREA